MSCVLCALCLFVAGVPWFLVLLEHFVRVFLRPVAGMVLGQLDGAVNGMRLCRFVEHSEPALSAVVHAALIVIVVVDIHFVVDDDVCNFGRRCVVVRYYRRR